MILLRSAIVAIHVVECVEYLNEDIYVSTLKDTEVVS